MKPHGLQIAGEGQILLLVCEERLFRTVQGSTHPAAWCPGCHITRRTLRASLPGTGLLNMRILRFLPDQAERSELCDLRQVTFFQIHAMGCSSDPGFLSLALDPCFLLSLLSQLKSGLPCEATPTPTRLIPHPAFLPPDYHHNALPAISHFTLCSFQSTYHCLASFKYIIFKAFFKIKSCSQ